MGGRVAEELIFGFEELSTGCSQDLKQATNIASELIRGMGYVPDKNILLSGDVEKMSEETNKFSDEQMEFILRVT